MLGAGEVSADVPWFWSDQYELTFQMAGAPPRGERTVERDVGAEALMLFHLDRDGRLVGARPGARSARQPAHDRARPRARSTALADPATRLKALLR
jgi:3-phenylpropionate/trans-cinnamate dioxygenase ferredoxin reductase subunit